MGKESGCYTFKELVEMFPVSARTLRRVVGELGYKPPLGRHKLILSEVQVDRVREALTWREPKRVPPPPPLTKEQVRARRIARRRETKEIHERVLRHLRANGWKA